jgi:hypothetical protein
MDRVKEMLTTHPKPGAANEATLAECIEACYECAQACTACADACLGEEKVQNLVKCIRLNLDCFDVCVTTGNLLSRQTHANWSLLRHQLEACMSACKVCGDECESHAKHHDHCRICAEACRRCEEACAALLKIA